MHWTDRYTFFLFDLDGLLVNTEELHYRAYVTMCKNRGYLLDWDFTTYFSIAQQDAEAPQRAIFAKFPELQRYPWSTLYAEKKKAYLNILEQTSVPLMAGAKELLVLLEKKQKKRCVVTHSQRELVDMLCKKNPLLQSIPHWFTREDYLHPKPAPDGYLKAIDSLKEAQDAIIGFEDSKRGLCALMQTEAKAVLVNSMDAKMRDEYAKQGIQAFTSLEEVLLPDSIR